MTWHRCHPFPMKLSADPHRSGGRSTHQSPVQIPCPLFAKQVAGRAAPPRKGTPQSCSLRKSPRSVSKLGTQKTGNDWKCLLQRWRLVVYQTILPVDLMCRASWSFGTARAHQYSQIKIKLLCVDECLKFRMQATIHYSLFCQTVNLVQYLHQNT